MPTIITLLAIVIVFLLIKVIKQAIRINDLEAYYDWEETDKHVHKDNGMVYVSNPPKYKCKDCGKFYLINNK